MNASREVFVKITACDQGRELACSECGSIGHASCDCAAPYVRVAAALADEKNRHRSNRAIAKDLGVSDMTVGRARRKATATHDAVEAPRLGLDGKVRRLPQHKPVQANSDDYEECTDCDTPQKRWERSAMNIFGEFLSMRAFWRKEFGAWEKLERSSALVTLAKQVAEEASAMASLLSK